MIQDLHLALRGGGALVLHRSTDGPHFGVAMVLDHPLGPGCVQIGGVLREEDVPYVLEFLTGQPTAGPERTT